MSTAPNNKLSPFMLLALLISMGATFWMMFNYIGPFQWFAEFQLAHLGSYSEKLTFMLTYLLIFGGLTLLGYPLRKLVGGAPATGSSAVDLSGGLLVALIGLGFAGVGGWKIYKAQHVGNLAPLSLDQLESGKPPASQWVSVTGIPFNDAAATFGKSGSTKDKFIPVISGASDTQKVGVHLFLKVGEAQAVAGDAQNPGRFEGMIVRNDLPGPLRTSLQHDGVIKGEDYYVLEQGQTPAKWVSDGKVMAAIGGGITALGLVVALVQKIRSPRATPAI